MAENETVVVDSHGSAQPATRDRSTIEFPYQALDVAVEIATAVHQVGGSSCQWDQLAAQLGQTPGGGFRGRVQTTRIFGLVTYALQTVRLTRLGIQINDPQQEKAAKADAFLVVPLYNAIYEQYKGVTLPPNDALEAEMVKLGVAPKQKKKARQVFQRSATEAGYFWSGSNRLVKPAIKSSVSGSKAGETEKAGMEHDASQKKPEDEKKEKRHPLIEGLLQELPEPQSEWTTEERKRWLEMASTIFNVIYKDTDDSRGSLKVVVERNSAK